jgi:hypothetical protein
MPCDASRPRRRCERRGCEDILRALLGAEVSDGDIDEIEPVLDE